MKFLIIGAGSVGTSLAKSLADHNHDVVLIEANESRAFDNSAEGDYLAVVGNGCNPGTLIEAGIQTADFIVAVTNNDEVNIAACLVAKLINNNCKRIARIRDISFEHSDIAPEHLAEHFDLIINPSLAAAEHLVRLFKAPRARDSYDFADGRLRVVGLKVTSTSPVKDQKLIVLQKKPLDYPILVLAIVRNGKLTIPRGTDRVMEGDLIYSMSVPEGTKYLFELAGQEFFVGKTAMIWGGSAIARPLVEQLTKLGVDIKLLMTESWRAQEAAEDVSDNVIVFNGSGLDQDLLEQENVSSFDAFFAVSADEEDNILSSLLAKRLGAKVVFALINQPDYLPLTSAIGIDGVVSSRVAAAAEIFQHIHADAVASELLLPEHNAGFLEVYASEEMSFINIPLKDLKLPHGIIIAALVSKNGVKIPKGDDAIKAGDRVVIFVEANAVKKLEKILNIQLEFFQ
ncbi:MAG: Trk system potassium transporter TrkA [Bdellovibrionales bacterium]|nr:Trk system potassium transporter TrkA [Bdellovibrionales bacterium]